MPGEEILLVNPRRRKRKSRKARRAYSARRRSRGSRVRRRRLRNPRSGFGGSALSIRGAQHAIVPAVVGAAGAMVLDIGMSYLPLPASLQAGWARTAVQIAAALALGAIGGRIPFVGRRNAMLASGGALTVIAYNALKPVVAQAIGDKVQGLGGLADFGDFRGLGFTSAAPLLAGPRVGAYQRPLGAYQRPGVGAYQNQSANDMM